MDFKTITKTWEKFIKEQESIDSIPEQPWDRGEAEKSLGIAGKDTRASGRKKTDVSSEKSETSKKKKDLVTAGEVDEKALEPSGENVDNTHVLVTERELERFRGGKLQENNPNSWPIIGKYWDHINQKWAGDLTRDGNYYPECLNEDEIRNIYNEKEWDISSIKPWRDSGWRFNKRWGKKAEYCDQETRQRNPKKKCAKPKKSTEEVTNLCNSAEGAAIKIGKCFYYICGYLHKMEAAGWKESHVENWKRHLSQYNGEGAFWSAAFIQFCMQSNKMFQKISNNEHSNLGNHMRYIYGAKENTKLLRQGTLGPGEWFYITAAEAEKIKYIIQVGDIAMSMTGHGDIMTNRGLVGGNVSGNFRSTCKVVSHGRRSGYITQNPQARALFEKQYSSVKEAREIVTKLKRNNKGPRIHITKRAVLK